MDYFEKRNAMLKVATLCRKGELLRQNHIQTIRVLLNEEEQHLLETAISNLGYLEHSLQERKVKHFTGRES